MLGIVILLTYIFFSALDNGGFIWSDKQFLHYYPQLTGAFGVAFIIAFFFIISMIISIIHIIILLIIRKKPKLISILNLITFVILLIVNLYLVLNGLVPLSDGVNFWVIVDCCILWWPVLISNFSVFMATLFIIMLVTPEDVYE